MILQCRECKARYVIPDSAIGAEGRMVRCANCKRTWFEKPSPPSAEPLPPLEQMLNNLNAAPAVEARPIPKGSNLPVRPHRHAPLGLKATAVLAALVAVALALLLFMPGLFGYPPSQGLALADIAMNKQVVQDRTRYEISGKIVNSDGKTLPVPTLRVTLVDSAGSLLQFWEFSEPGKTLEAGKTLPFTTGTLEPRFSASASRFVVELGNKLELALRRKP